ncbi:MAG: phosphotransferase family protein [Porticoccaceae bacterium]|nr:phosphotransferase family protein [Porticoccaceae bacterium]
MIPSNPTIDVRIGEELDPKRLDEVLKQVITGLKGTPYIKQFPSGASNLTYLIGYDNRELVLRRPPPGAKAASAHSMIREYRVISALQKEYPAVPKAIFYTDDESMLGSEFYLMEKIEGVLIKDKIPADWSFTNSDRNRFSKIVFDKLIELHTVDYKAAGLGEFGKPQGYAERQILGWNKRFANAKTPDVPGFEDVREWLEANIPDQTSSTLPAALIHGDYRIDNVMLDPKDPFNVVAVLDWEMAALGDPLMDLSNALAYWVHRDDPPWLQGILKQPSDAPGMMRREDVIAYYGEETGFDVSKWDFYEVYGYWRLVGILQQLYFRYVNKLTQDQRFADYGQVTTQLGEYCRALIAKSTL